MDNQQRLDSEVQQQCMQQQQYPILHINDINLQKLNYQRRIENCDFKIKKFLATKLVYIYLSVCFILPIVFNTYQAYYLISIGNKQKSTLKSSQSLILPHDGLYYSNIATIMLVSMYGCFGVGAFISMLAFVDYVRILNEKNYKLSFRSYTAIGFMVLGIACGALSIKQSSYSTQKSSLIIFMILTACLTGLIGIFSEWEKKLAREGKLKFEQVLRNKNQV